MSNLLRRGLVTMPVLTVPVVAALLVGALPAHAVARTAAPAAHVKVCADDGMTNAASMTLVSSTSAKQSSKGHTSRAKAWVYAVPDATTRCVVLKVTGPKVRTTKRQSLQASVGYVGSSNSTNALESGEVLPINHEQFSYGGASGRDGLVAHVRDVVEEGRYPDEVLPGFPPSFSALAGQKIRTTLTSLEFKVNSEAWTTTQLATPLTKAQRTKKFARELKVAKTRYASRMSGATAARDEQYALAAATSGLAADWLKFYAEDAFSKTTVMAGGSLQASKKIARQHAAQAGKGSDFRETYAHEFSLVVPVS